MISYRCHGAEGRLFFPFAEERVLKALPVGTRWGVAVGQGIANAGADIDTPQAIRAPITCILAAAVDGQQNESLHPLRTILWWVKKVNPLTSPARDEGFPLKTSKGTHAFQGEE